MRNLVINEIINTERDYVKDLQIIMDQFRNPLKEEGILSEEELRDIFSNINLLIKVNTELLDDIFVRVKETKGDQLGQSFILLV